MIFSTRTINILKDAGWYPERKIEIGSTINFLEKRGFEVFYPAKEAFEHFGGLKYSVPSDESDDFQIGPEFLREGIERKHYSRYEKIIGEELVLIGWAYDGNATMFMSKIGKVYGIIDDYYIWKFGNNVYEAMNNLCESKELTVICKE
ncbi:SUKH-3 domain-containing protein [Paenibacillus sp. CMAA1739]|uniref:SUKH-3 domain-containing protein n=1 Tax=Paenibacillus ottowii TaxID=2315729 RepID=UPI0027321481|nr:MULTISPECIES: SUKH-3 domain-containing protein [Paenibacillus]MDP1512468.1 SUKH-3 domain-containing protein [Paenibacillus ottowii]MEC4564438.1 SUKH-3 domain-containing protein [Paenibacillus sp. CMAA1739]